MKAQKHNQNAEKITHIKGRPLDQEMILFNCVHFQNGNYSMENHLITLSDLLECYYFNYARAEPA